MDKAKVSRFAACAAALFLSGVILCAVTPASFSGTWQMDAAKSKVNDGRTVDLTIAATDSTLSMTFKTHKGGADTTSQFSGKFDGKPSDFMEGSHKSKIICWWDGSSLNASKESGPPEDATSMWKLTLDGQTLTMTINHYDPAAADETLVFTKGPAAGGS